ncbi:hypothetical protein PspLS_04703 [Pyricularia sp. CBS 133598]|nr:hypothetical protein PspLS_04703 [Pyricularia sp. CBS 133598]
MPPPPYDTAVAHGVARMISRTQPAPDTYLTRHDPAHEAVSSSLRPPLTLDISSLKKLSIPGAPGGSRHHHYSQRRRSYLDYHVVANREAIFICSSHHYPFEGES